MMEKGFDLALKAALEESLGFALDPLVRLDGNTTLNFKAIRASDGFAFAVKCSPPGKRTSFEVLLAQYAALEGTKAARRLFPDRIARFRDYDILILSWIDGARVFPDELTGGQMAAFVDDYLDFSAALQSVTPICPSADLAQMRRATLSKCCGFWARGIRHLLESELTEDRLALEPGRMRVIHGDLHHGNFLFKDGRVSGFFDFECMTRGYPAEDFIRYFVCATEHLRWYNQYRKCRILRLFGLVVACAPYAREEWETAIDRLLMDKIGRKSEDHGLGFLMSVNLLYRARLYRDMKRIVAKALAGREVKT